jgi:hypothetical protein
MYREVEWRLGILESGLGGGRGGGRRRAAAASTMASGCKAAPAGGGGRGGATSGVAGRRGVRCVGEKKRSTRFDGSTYKITGGK